MQGDGSQVFNNFGKVIGTYDNGILIGSFSTSSLLNNHGIILSAGDGIFANTLGTCEINNYGFIKGGTNGIESSSDSAFTTKIFNAATGVILGGTAILCETSMFMLTKQGKIVGKISDIANLHDVVLNTGTIKGLVLLGGGNDVFDGNGGISGGVFGEAGVDHLAGGAKADRLHGGYDNDILTGRLGADQFFFDTALMANIDRITDFTPAQGDKIVLDVTYFGGIGAVGALTNAHFHVGAPVNGNAQIVYTLGNGFLYYDPDGNTSGARTHFATLGTHPVIHNTDFIVAA
jgi:Ca2+-binding RTX toxin-like protein